MTGNKAFSVLKSLTLVLILLIPANLWADDWVLAAQAFTFAQKNTPSASALHSAQSLPQLILEQIATGSSRELPESEVLDRTLNTLQTERISLFLQLSKEVKTRDALVLTTESKRKLAKKIAAEDEKIAEIQAKIDENLKTTDEEIQKAKPKIEKEQNLSQAQENAEAENHTKHFPFPFFWSEEEDEKTKESVALYKNDATTLFKASDSAVKEGFESRAFSKEVVSAKINGLISGSIVVFGDYAAVTAELRTYPGAKVMGSVTEVGTLANLIPLAQRLVRSLTPKIANSLPVTLHFMVSPPDVRPSVVIDDMVYPQIPDQIVVDASIHTISISAKGYETATINYKFDGNDQYTIQANLVPAVSGVAKIRLKKFRDGVFYARALESLPVTEEKKQTELSINGKSVLGIFTTTVQGEDEEAPSAFFYIPPSMVQENMSYVINANPFDRAANIDKRRRWLYTSYTALILSLPATFYCYGNFNSVNNSYNLGRSSYDDAVMWQNRSYITMGITGACGAWMVFELIRYLKAANDTLPATAKKEKVKD